MSQPPTVNIQGAAQILQVHTKTVLSMINDGVLPAARIGRAYVLMTKDVLQYAENQIIAQTAVRMGTPLTRAIRPNQRHAN